MVGEYLLKFQQNKERTLPLPRECTISVGCFESKEIQQAIVRSLQEAFYALALTGTDLSALDGVTVAPDTRRAAYALQDLPEGLISPEIKNQPKTMELARMVPVKRGTDYRFHIVFRVGVGLMMLSSKQEEKLLACGCIAHEAAHVEHEGHLYKKFPGLYGHTLNCGERARQAFLKSLDVWSEYAACRSSAGFRTDALQDFDKVFCEAFKSARSEYRMWIENYRAGGEEYESIHGIEQVFGDLFICAGYLLGHIHGMELHGLDNAPATWQMLVDDPAVGEVLMRLERALHELWLSEFDWDSVEVFAPIYNLLCEMMALYGLAFVRYGDGWRIIMSDKATGFSELKEVSIPKTKIPD